MKKSILNLGKALSKAEQKSVFGGSGERFRREGDCGNSHEGDSNCLCGGDKACMAIVPFSDGRGSRPVAGRCQGGACVV